MSSNVYIKPQMTLSSMKQQNVNSKKDSLSLSTHQYDLFQQVFSKSKTLLNNDILK